MSTPFLTARERRRLRGAKPTGPVRDEGGQPEGNVLHPDDLSNHASTVVMCKDIGDLLDRLYPGFLWAIQPDDNGKIINILCLNFNTQYGYTIRYTDIMNDPRRREAIKGADEILRRFRYPVEQARRGRQVRFDPQLALSVPRDPQGEAIPDLSDMKGGKRRMQAEIDLALAQGRMEIVTTSDGVYAKVKS